MKWGTAYLFSASPSKHSLSWIKEQLSSHTRLVCVVKGCLCNCFQSQLKPKEKICQAAAGALQTIHDIWWKFKLTYVVAGNKENSWETWQLLSINNVTLSAPIFIRNFIGWRCSWVFHCLLAWLHCRKSPGSLQRAPRVVQTASCPPKVTSGNPKSMSGG